MNNARQELMLTLVFVFILVVTIYEKRAKQPVNRVKQTTKQLTIESLKEYNGFENRTNSELGLSIELIRELTNTLINSKL